MRSPRGIMCPHSHTVPPPCPARHTVPGREAVPRAWWSGRHGTRYLLQETSRIVHRLRLQRVMAAAATATAVGAALRRLRKAQVCSSVAALHGAAALMSPAVRARVRGAVGTGQSGCRLRFVASPFMSCVCVAALSLCSQLAQQPH